VICLGAGQEFVKSIRPIGCVFFLLIFIYFMVFCFTPHGSAIPGYVSPHDYSYYSRNDGTLGELKTELETNVFPHIAGITGCEVKSGRLEIDIEKDDFSSSRATILKYYDKNLFDFEKSESAQTQQ